MNNYRIVKSKYFVVTGISHRDAEVSVREKFSLDEPAAEKLMHEYKQNGGEAIFVLSTCNRTELYALTDSPETISELLIRYSGASAKAYATHCYLHKNEQAIEHLFKVGVGLESQILGDFQIIGQLRKAFRLSKANGASHAFMERLINTVSQSSKQVKNETDFSSGAASTSYAAVNYIKSRIPDYQDKRVLLYGTGKIGQLVCENLIKHLPKEQITVVNRSQEKASRLVEKYNISLGQHRELVPLIGTSDIVIVATGANAPTITKEMVKDEPAKYFLDLSMPRNVSKEVELLPQMTVADLDGMAKIADETLDRRKEQIGKVKEIIARHMAEFNEWLQQRKFVPTIAAIRQQLEDIQQSEIRKFKKEFSNADEAAIQHVSSDIIRKITNQLFSQLKSVPDDSIDLVHHLFKIDSSRLP